MKIHKIKMIRAFTFFELLISMLILLLLGTISFMAYSGYIKHARDTIRISDIFDIKESLELFNMQKSYYPIPDNKNQILYDNDLLWTQGIIGENVKNSLYKILKKIPLDPLTNQEYTYSLLDNNSKYELLSIYESNLVTRNLSVETSKISTISDYYNKIEGNYNGLYIKTPNYYIPIPSIITSENIVGGLNINESNIKSQIITGGSNSLTINSILYKTGLLDIKLSVYTGSVNTYSSDLDKQNLVLKIQESYSGSVILNYGNYKEVLGLMSLDECVDYVDYYILE